MIRNIFAKTYWYISEIPSKHGLHRQLSRNVYSCDVEFLSRDSFYCRN
uniref:Uncharacterized protein n=1 Tax=Arundo donax TaxID=35708 RepID=A0A0A8Z3Q3_ARUDO